MASELDRLTKLPLWQLLVGWVFVALLLGAGWYYLYYADAVETRDREANAFTESERDRKKMEEKLANFEAEMEKAAAAQREIDASMEVLPISDASVDHLMRTFQQQGRMVGIAFDRWNPRSEEITKHYARTAVDVDAVGTWNQLGEFFRRISQMKKIVSIHKLRLGTKDKGRRGLDGGVHPQLSIRFEASAYRFLNDDERAGRTGGKSRRRGGRR